MSNQVEKDNKETYFLFKKKNQNETMAANFTLKKIKNENGIFIFHK